MLNAVPKFAVSCQDLRAILGNSMCIARRLFGLRFPTWVSCPGLKAKDPGSQLCFLLQPACGAHRCGLGTYRWAGPGVCTPGRVVVCSCDVRPQAWLWRGLSDSNNFDSADTAGTGNPRPTTLKDSMHVDFSDEQDNYKLKLRFDGARP